MSNFNLYQSKIFGKVKLFPGRAEVPSPPNNLDKVTSLHIFPLFYGTVFRRAMKRFTQGSHHRTFKVQSNATPQELRLFDFIGKHRDKRATQSYHSKLNRTTQSIDMWKQRNLQLTAPSKIDVSLLIWN